MAVTDVSSAAGRSQVLELLRMLGGYRLTQALYVATKLGIADLLKDGHKRVDELAAATGTHVRSLYRLLRLLASAGVFVELDRGDFTVSPLAALLQSDVPGSLRPLVITYGELWWRPWGALLHSVQTGETAFSHVYKMPQFEYLAQPQNAEFAEMFSRNMTSASLAHARAVLAAYDFSGTDTVVDVAGGEGTLIAEILRAHPQMRGVLLDTPQVVAGARRVLETAGVAARCEAVGGDFFESVPIGGDTYILKWIIHDWEDEAALAILRNCRRALAGPGKLLVIEHVMPDDYARSSEDVFDAAMMDVHMLVLTGGCVRTANEHRALLTAASLDLRRIIPTASGLSIIEAAPVHAG